MHSVSTIGIYLTHGLLWMCAYVRCVCKIRLRRGGRRMKTGSLLSIHSIYLLSPHLPSFPFPFLARHPHTPFLVSAEYVTFLIMCMVFFSQANPA